MLSLYLSRVIILIAGVVFPAYSSYKAIREKNVKGYVKWLIYWIIYAMFASIESVMDLFVAWIPFYYEIKILILLWLVSPASQGSIRFYVHYFHPLLLKRENDIDALLSHFKDLLYLTVVKIFGYIFKILRSSLSAGHQLILDQIKQKYQLREIKSSPNNSTTETQAESSMEKVTEELDYSEPLQTTEVINEQIRTEDSVSTPATIDPEKRISPATSKSISSSRLSPSGVQSSVLDSRSLSSDRSKSTVTNPSFYDRYTRLAYGTTSSYTSKSSHSSLPQAAGTSYDRRARPTTTSSSRYSSSSYSSRYQRK